MRAKKIQEKMKMFKCHWKESELPEKEVMPGVWLKSIYENDQLVTIVTFKPFATVMEHSHEEQQISVIIEGKMDVVIGSMRYTANKGDVVVVPPNTMHSVEVSPRGAKAVETWNSIVKEYIVEDESHGVTVKPVISLYNKDSEEDAPDASSTEPEADDTV